MVDERNRAEALFADWLSRRDAGKSVPIAWFAAAHPAHANELLHFHRVWKRLDEFGAVAQSTEPDDAVAARLKARLLHRPAAASARGDLAPIPASPVIAATGTSVETLPPPAQAPHDPGADEADTIGDEIEFAVDASTSPVVAPQSSVAPIEAVALPRAIPPSRDLLEIFALARTGAEGWNLTRAVSTILRVCEAMEGSHEKGVLHRDLGPTNVKIGRHGEVFVMDWGSARVAGAPETRDIRPDPNRTLDAPPPSGAPGFATPLLTKDGDVITSPSCLSPERANGDLEAMGPWSDVYSIGAMLYHLLAGHPPYLEPEEIENGKAVLRRILAGPPEPIQSRARHAPAELAAICERAMARSPKQRYPRVSDLADDLRAYLERRVVKAYRVGLIPETKTWLRRHRDVAAAIGVVFLVVLGFALERHREADRADSARRTADAELAAARESVEHERARASERERVFRLSDRDALEDLENRGRALLEDPAEVYRSARGYHALLGSLENWIDDAERVLARRSEHRSTLAEVEARGSFDPASGTWAFDSIEDAWWRDRLVELIAAFDRLAGTEPGAITIAAMRARAAEYARIHERSIASAREAWEHCIAAIADVEANPIYGGLRIAPQLGLIPLGRDPASSLWEFALPSEGTSPPSRGADGRLDLRDDPSLVFVLLPGGTFWMGAQSEDPSGPNYDPWAFSDLAPVRRVALAPFFLSKYELTERQWASLSGGALTAARDGGRDAVAAVSWFDAVATLNRFALDLPSEAQWEYACRAGSSTPWSTGSEAATLAGFANVRIPQLEGLIGDDEAPIGSFRANAFGLHDMHGNLFEWCRDGFLPPGGDDARFDPVTSERLVDSPALRVFRGGCFREEANVARSAFRLGKDPKARVVTIGLRARRELMPD